MMTGTEKYHCLIAGLPELDLSSMKSWISSGEFRTQLEEEIHPDDFAMVRLLFMRLDNDHLVDFIENGSFERMEASNFSEEDFKNQVEQFDAILPEEDQLPPYMVDMLREYMKSDSNPDRVDVERIVADRYYDYIMEHGNDFLKEYTQFEYNTSNLLAYIEAGNHATDPWKFISGDTIFVMNLREDKSVTMAASAGFEMFNEITCYAELPFLSEKEMRYDEVRWRMIEEMAFFDEFTVDSILAYLMKILLIERWTRLEKEAGEEKLREMVEAARNSSREKMKEHIQ
jgi:hypothetical protein